MDSKTKGKIINALRRLTFSYPPRNNVKKRQKVAPATFECEHCGIWVYEGTKQLEILDLTPPNGLVKGRSYMDHKQTVIPTDGFQRDSWDWDEFINRLFCEEEDLQCLCKECHDSKTFLEDQMRKEYRQQKKLTKK